MGSQIGDWLAAARKAAGLSRVQAAAAIGVAEKTIQRWESGESPPGSDLLLKAVAAYGKSISDLDQYVSGRDMNVPRGTSVLRESMPIPYGLGRRFEAFTREMIRAGATDAEVDFLADLLRRPETGRLIKVTQSGEILSDRAVDEQWDALLDDFRAFITRRVTRRTGAVPAIETAAIERQLLTGAKRATPAELARAREQADADESPAPRSGGRKRANRGGRSR